MSYDRLLLQLADLNGDCQQNDPELWFADERHKADQRYAKGVCSLCPQLNQCQSAVLDFELATNENLYGIYGGLTEKERRQIIKKERRGA